MMNTLQFSIIWPLYLIVNILILSVVYYFTLDTVISVFMPKPIHLSVWQSVCASIVTLAVRGMFSIRMERD